MQPHSGAVITLISYYWPTRDKLAAGAPTWSTTPLELLPHKVFGIRTEYFGRTKLHSIQITRVDLRNCEAEYMTGKDYPCFLRVRFNFPKDKVEFCSHNHTPVKEEFNLNLPHSLSGDYMSEPKRGFKSSKHVITGQVIVPDSQIKFADVFEGDLEDPLKKYNFEYQCKIDGMY